MKPAKEKEEEFMLEGPEAELERLLIDDYLKHHGVESIKDLCKLPEAAAKKLMIDACRYVSLKLATIESRVNFEKEIHTDF